MIHTSFIISILLKIFVIIIEHAQTQSFLLPTRDLNVIKLHCQKSTKFRKKIYV